MKADGPVDLLVELPAASITSGAKVRLCFSGGTARLKACPSRAWHESRFFEQAADR
jgi:hypothetical protein